MRIGEPRHEHGCREPLLASCSSANAALHGFVRQPRRGLSPEKIE
jgi:hypothetical protein